MSLVELANLVTSFCMVYVSWVMAHEAQKMRETETEPDVTVYLDYNHILHLDLVIKNNGRGAALDIKFEFEDADLPVIDPDNPELTKLSHFSYFQGLHVLAPGQELRTWFSRSCPESRNFLPKISYTYLGKSGKKHQGQVVLAMNCYSTVFQYLDANTRLSNYVRDIRDDLRDRGESIAFDKAA